MSVIHRYRVPRCVEFTEGAKRARRCRRPSSLHRLRLRAALEILLIPRDMWVLIVDSSARTGVSVPVQLRHRAVVADDVQVDGGDETVVQECGQRGLRVEGVSARQTNHLRVTLDPLVRDLGIALVHFGIVLRQMLELLGIGVLVCGLI
eukprot:938241-Prorocentrum_minimum.AAC.4